MAEIATAASEVREFWLAQGLQVSSVTPEDIARLERMSPREPPEDLAIFLRVAGLPDREDREGFRFWLPQEIRPTNEVLNEAGYKSTAIAQSLVFADYLQESWWYGIWLSGPFRGHVSLVLGTTDGSDPQPPLGSLSDFLEAYLCKDSRLYPR